MKIRLATLRDCKQCAELSRIEELKPALGGFIPERYFRCFVDKDKLFLVAEENKKIIGYILGEPMKGRVAYIGLLTVVKEKRGQGLGQRLVNKFREQCDRKRLNYLLLYAPKSNKKTIGFYQRCGFTRGKEYIHFAEER